MKYYALLLVLLIGTVDRIENNMVVGTVQDSELQYHDFEMPLSVFPCEISEGDSFYFNYVDGVTEIRCGEPEPE